MQESPKSTETPALPRRYARLRRILLIAVGVPTILAILLILAHRPILVGYASLFRVDNPAPSDAIVILLGGTPHRPERAAKLYHAGIAPLIVLCREKVDPVLHQDMSNLIRDYLVTLGVPPKSILILPEEVASTKDEADRVSKYFDTHPARRITVVTTAFHTARARWIFRKILKGKGVDIRTSAATDPNFDESNWYQTEEGLIFYFNETIKTIFYRLKY